MKKNITLAMDEKVLHEVRRIAVEHDTTVNGLVRDYLEQLSSRKAQKVEFRKKLAELLNRTHARVGAVNWNREEIHAR